MARGDKYCQLRKDIVAIAADSFHTYGYRRIWHVLCARGIRVSEKVVRKIISEDKILVRYPRRKRRYSSYNGEIASAPENLVKRNFHTNAPWQAMAYRYNRVHHGGIETVSFGCYRLF